MTTTSPPRLRGWQPNPGPQSRFIASPHFEVLYGGSRHCGRTEALLGQLLGGHRLEDPRDHTSKIVQPPRYQRARYRALYLTPSREETRSLLERALELWSSFGARRDAAQVVFPTGCQVSFSHQPDPSAAKDVWAKNPMFVGRPIDLYAFDDLQDFDEDVYLRFVRAAAWAPLAEERVVRATAHPEGRGRAWVRARFARHLDPQHDSPLASGQYHSVEYGGAGERRRQVVRATLDDCYQTRDSAVARELRALSEPRRSWLYLGDWQVEDDAALDPASPAALARYRDDPVGFAHDVLGVERLWSRQRDILEAVASHPRVAVRAGRKVSKSNSVAVAALWFAMTRPRAQVIITAPVHKTIKDVLWPEITRLAQRARVPVPAPALSPETGIRWPDGRRVWGTTSNQPENLRGPSGAQMLYLVDEADAVAHDIYDVIKGNLAGADQDGSMLMVSNPTTQAGYYFDAFNDADKMAIWHRIHISSLESPNITGECEAIPGLATKRFVEEAKVDWGEGSPPYQAHVLGEFPTEGSDQVVSLALVDAGKRRYAALLELDAELVGVLHIGVDVARFGDDRSWAYPRRGNVILPALKLTRTHRPDGKIDTMSLANQVYAYVLANREPGEAVVVKVDVIGVGGGVADRLRELELLDVVVGGKVVRRDRVMHVVDVNVAEKSDDPDRYPNKRSQLWFALREFLEQGGAFPADSKLEGELLAPVFRVTSRGQREVEPKDKTKEKIRRSPDQADAICLAIYSPRLVDEAPRGRGGPVGGGIDSVGIY